MMQDVIQRSREIHRRFFPVARPVVTFRAPEPGPDRQADIDEWVAKAEQEVTLDRFGRRDMPLERSRQLLALVCAKHGAKVEDVLGTARRPHAVAARRETARILVDRLNMSLPSAGVAIGGREPSTIHEMIGRKKPH